jgi:hypothetical protein
LLFRLLLLLGLMGLLLLPQLVCGMELALGWPQGARVLLLRMLILPCREEVVLQLLLPCKRGEIGCQASKPNPVLVEPPEQLLTGTGQASSSPPGLQCQSVQCLRAKHSAGVVLLCVWRR